MREMPKIGYDLQQREIGSLLRKTDYPARPWLSLILRQRNQFLIRLVYGTFVCCCAYLARETALWDEVPR